MIPLSAETRDRIRAVFPTNEAQVSEYLEAQCGATLPGVRADDPQWHRLVQRVRFAVLRISNGDIDALKAAVDRAHVDWRDTLVAAGFAESVDAHLAWSP